MPGRRTLSALVIVGLLVATAVTSFLSYERERDAANERNATLARQAAAAARQDVTAMAAGLKGGTAVLSPEGDIAPQRFRSFARDILRRSPFPSLAWSRSVAAAEREEFEATRGFAITRRTGFGAFRPVPEGVEREFLPVARLFPASRNRSLLGFDLLSDPRREPTVRAALGEGMARLSPPLPLLRTGQSGAVIYSPVAPPGAENAAGVLAAAVPGEAIADAVRRRLDIDSAISISDGGVTLVGEPEAGTAAESVGMLGRRWNVSLSGGVAMDVTPAVAWAAAGLALTFVAASLFWAAARRERDLSNRRADAELQMARESLLVRIGEAIEREIEGDARLGSLARELVPAVGDVCVVHEVTGAGSVRRVGVAAPDERTAELIRALPEPPATSPIRAAISSQEPVLYTRVSEDREALRARGRGIPQRDVLSDLNPDDAMRTDQRSNMIVPLVARGQVLGTISISVLASTGRPPLTRDDLAFTMEVAAHAAVALDNARLYERQRDIAQILQGALVPRALPQIAGAKVAARHRAGMTGTEVGGDFYDLFEVAGRWMAVLGDVCGKGPQAAALTALARHTVRATARLGPAGAVSRVHEAIRTSGEHTYCTLCCAELTPDENGISVRVTTAGHPEPWILEADGTIRRLEVTGPLVGALDNPSFGAQDVRLESGALMFMCSDGVPEARRQGEVFGEHRLGALLSALSGEELELMLERVENEVVQFVEGRPNDDLALFALRVD